MNLDFLGWDASFADAFAPHQERGLRPARVATEDKHAYVLVGEPGEFSAVVSGRLLHQQASRAGLPKVGDWVAVVPPAGGGRAVIHAVLPRRTRLVRKVPGRQIEEQVLAANVDTAFIVQALDQSFNLRRQERFLLMVREGGAQPVVLLNKADLCSEAQARLNEAKEAAVQTPVLLTSARTGGGMAGMKEWIRPGKTAVFIGPSGVGKSSLINRLFGEEIQATIEVRQSDAKGRHATTWRELIRLPGGGLVIDTPGMREVQMGLDSELVHDVFPEIEELSVRCHFRDCSHTSEARCEVRLALADGRLARERFESYLKLRRELACLARARRQHTFLGAHRRTEPSR
jgi:ribosome biogenesis GTPase / thiamine phosphate phosphatase